MVSQDGESRGFVVLTPPQLVVLNGLRLAEIHNSGKPCLGGCRSMPASMSLAGVEGFGPRLSRGYTKKYIGSNIIASST